MLLAFGCWLLLDYSFLAVWAVLLLLWFNFVIAPFQEAELKAIFGEQYKHYSNKVPKMIPFAKSSKPFSHQTASNMHRLSHSAALVL
ncbi:MAG: hypothetical protein QXU87_10510 [Candidatus Caldarchaeum sp.]|uniref:Isoprenylcysteine carboxylmethyltransferase family protein n=1 Tax=Caldiarchaeum subterraneum TaxID=311458 RepID=A0A7C5LF89_CALS0